MHAFGEIGGSGCEASRLRKRPISVGMSDMEPLPDQARDVFANRLESPQEEESSIAQYFLSPQIHHRQASGIHVNRLFSNLLPPSPQPLCAIPPAHIPEGVVLPISSFDAGKGILDSQTDLMYENTGVRTSPLAKWLNKSSTYAMDFNRVDPFSPTTYNADSEAATDFSMALCPVTNMELMQDFMVPMSHALIEEGSNEDINHVDGHNSGAIIRSRDSRARNASDKLRRAKIAEGIKALQYSIPFSDKGKKESVLDDVIDYVKFLKLQLKVLSQSRLFAEAAPYPFVHLEGYGHYFVHQLMCSEPLEEVMGQLMDEDMQAASELMESKGLAILPMDLAYTLLQTS